MVTAVSYRYFDTDVNDNSLLRRLSMSKAAELAKMGEVLTNSQLVADAILL